MENLTEQKIADIDALKAKAKEDCDALDKNDFSTIYKIVSINKKLKEDIESIKNKK